VPTDRRRLSSARSLLPLRSTGLGCSYFAPGDTNPRSGPSREVSVLQHIPCTDSRSAAPRSRGRSTSRSRSCSTCCSRRGPLMCGDRVRARRRIPRGRRSRRQLHARSARPINDDVGCRLRRADRWRHRDHQLVGLSLGCCPQPQSRESPAPRGEYERHLLSLRDLQGDSARAHPGLFGRIGARRSWTSKDGWRSFFGRCCSSASTSTSSNPYVGRSGARPSRWRAASVDRPERTRLVTHVCLGCAPTAPVALEPRRRARADRPPARTALGPADRRTAPARHRS
jgi:hypothetical protein